MMTSYLKSLSTWKKVINIQNIDLKDNNIIFLLFIRFIYLSDVN